MKSTRIVKSSGQEMTRAQAECINSAILFIADDEPSIIPIELQLFYFIFLIVNNKQSIIISKTTKYTAIGLNRLVVACNLWTSFVK
jgi:hypothetical protein